GVPIYAHAITAEKLRGKVPVDRLLHDGDALDLGPAPDGSGSWHLEAIHTPGHAIGHLAFYERHYRLLFAGDMVSTLSSVVIAPPEGDLAQYLDSLKRLRSYDCRLLLPAHGSPSARPGKTIDECIDHRLRREGQLLAELNASPRSVADLARELYKGLAPTMMRFAELQILAGLQKLATLDAACVDLAFADPPFNIGYDYDVYQDRHAADHYLSWTRQWGGEIKRVLRKNGTFWLAIGDEYAAELKLIFQNDLGFTC